MNAGDTFLMPDAIGMHLYCVLAVLEDRSIIVCHLTTLRARTERTCILREGDHPFIDRDTAVHYTATHLCQAGEPLAAFERQIRKAYGPLKADVLDRMRKGAMASPNVADEIKSLLKPFVG
jgi:hypothetical protein